MTILFAPSETKRQGGTLPSLSPESFIFPEQFHRRQTVLERYHEIVQNGSQETLEALFGVKGKAKIEAIKNDIFSAPTMKAVLRYDGVAYEYLDYASLDTRAQHYVDSHTLIFSNLFGPVRAGDMLPEYKLKQGAKLGDFALEKHYQTSFANLLDDYLGDGLILDLRAGFYTKFYTPKVPYTTLKFIKNGTVVSHWAKAYRGIVLREAALHQIASIEVLENHKIEGLKLTEKTTKGLHTEIVYDIR